MFAGNSALGNFGGLVRDLPDDLEDTDVEDATELEGDFSREALERVSAISTVEGDSDVTLKFRSNFDIEAVPVPSNF